MNILEIYEKYQIMPQLVEHQLKVAGVAKVILDNLNSPLPNPPHKGEGTIEVGAGDIIKACLLHDMGNIIKFDLSITDKLNPGRFKQVDLDFWQKVKKEYILKYGSDEHHATMQIIKELGASERVVEFVDCIGFQNGKQNAESEDFGEKICAYSDRRVGPNGTIPLEKRFEDLRLRYDYKHRLMGGNENLRLEFETGLREIEKQIFAKCKIKPEDITDEIVREELEGLKKFEI